MQICNLCKESFKTRQIINGKLRNLCKRKYCPKCSPHGEHNTKKLEAPKLGKLCSCGEKDPVKFSPTHYSQCKRCRNRYNTRFGQRVKQKARDYLGGKCRACGFNKFQVALDIHHIDPSLKDPNFKGMRGWAWDRLKKELETCELLCRNCHAAFHVGLIK